MLQYDQFADWYIQQRNSGRFNPNKHMEMPAMFKLLGNIKYKEAKPIPSSKKFNSEAYETWVRNPYFLFFKLKK